MKSPKVNKFASLMIVLAVYILAVAGGYFTIVQFGGSNILINAAIGDVAATIIVFIFSVIFRNSSMYDPYWSVIPTFLFIYWMVEFQEFIFSMESAFILLVVALWGIRLTVNWIRGWSGLHAQDWRYTMLQQKTGKMYWIVSFLGIHLVPTIVVFLGCLPIYAYLKDPFPFGIQHFIAIIICITAIVVEAVADNQLRYYKKSSKEKSLEHGLWGFSRHPNYLGEIGFWMGLFLIVLVQAPSHFLWTGVGIFSMISLFVFISIPMMEKRLVDSKPGYQEYQKRVSMLIPWIRR